jgi:hypothetical protein
MEVPPLAHELPRGAHKGLEICTSTQAEVAAHAISRLSDGDECSIFLTGRRKVR